MPRGKGPNASPIRSRPGAARRAVEQTNCRAAEECPYLMIPHHPSGGAVPVESFAEGIGGIAGAQIQMQVARAGQDDDSSMSVDDCFRQTGSPAGIQNPQRVIEW